jgi:tellurite methyltransferase
VGLRLAQQNAQRVLGRSNARQLIACRAADLRSVTDLGRERYGLVIVFFFLRRKLFPALVRALRPGGTLIYRTYTLAQLAFERGPRDPRFLLQPGELCEAFSGLEILHYEESATDKGVAELVARKPTP